MRKSLSLAAVAAASSALLLVPATSAFAAGHVLTISKTGGTAVKVGALLKSGLAKGKTATFSLGSNKLTCKVATFSAKVTTNPAKPGTAMESLTSQTFSKCTTPGITVKSLKVNNLPYNVTVGDASGDPVTIKGTSTSKPVQITATVSVSGIGTVVCTYKATAVKGNASNTGNTIAFTGQKFTFKSGNSLCPKSAASFAATFGPVKDSSVTGSPKVFVN